MRGSARRSRQQLLGSSKQSRKPGELFQQSCRAAAPCHSLLTVTGAVAAAAVRPFLLMAVTTKLQGPGARLVKVVRKGRAAVPSVC